MYKCTNTMAIEKQHQHHYNCCCCYYYECMNEISINLYELHVRHILSNSTAQHCCTEFNIEWHYGLTTTTTTTATASHTKVSHTRSTIWTDLENVYHKLCKNNGYAQLLVFVRKICIFNDDVSEWSVHDFCEHLPILGCIKVNGLHYL